MLTYLFYLTLCWASFALLYTTLLRKETFFIANRFYLLCVLAVGLVLPLLKEVINSAVGIAAFQQNRYLLPEVVVGIRQAGETIQQHTNWEWWMITIWVTGSLWMATRFIWGLTIIFQMVNKAEKRRKDGPLTLVYHEKAVLPFSFFHWVFIAPGMEEDAAIETMIAHERAHASGWHTLDILFCEVLCMLLWWNPLVYWYKNAIRAVHEYIADEATANQFSRKQYGLLLIRHAQSGPVHALANHFFQSPLKQRLIMLTKNASAPARGIKYALVIPVFTFVLFALQQSALFGQITDSKRAEEVKKEELVSPVSETEAEYPGGMPAFFKYIGEHLVYPEAARKAKVEGTVVVSFIVNAEGRVEKATATKSVRPDMDTAAIQVISSTIWIAGTNDGKKVSTELCIPIKFKL
jgi:TonB family protein